MVEVSLDRFGDEGEDTAGLLSASLDDGQNRFYEPAASGALSPERELSPDDRMTQAALAGVIGRLDPVDVEERPKPLPMIVQLLAHPIEPRVAAIDSAQQQALHAPGGLDASAASVWCG